jgi:hypothetical protein
MKHSASEAGLAVLQRYGSQSAGGNGQLTGNFGAGLHGGATHLSCPTLNSAAKEAGRSRSRGTFRRHVVQPTPDASLDKDARGHRPSNGLAPSPSLGRSLAGFIIDMAGCGIW